VVFDKLPSSAFAQPKAPPPLSAQDETSPPEKPEKTSHSKSSSKRSSGKRRERRPKDAVSSAHREQARIRRAAREAEEAKLNDLLTQAQLMEAQAAAAADAARLAMASASSSGRRIELAEKKLVALRESRDSWEALLADASEVADRREGQVADLRRQLLSVSMGEKKVEVDAATVRLQISRIAQDLKSVKRNIRDHALATGQQRVAQLYRPNRQWDAASTTEEPSVCEG